MHIIFAFLDIVIAHAVRDLGFCCRFSQYRKITTSFSLSVHSDKKYTDVTDPLCTHQLVAGPWMTLLAF